MDIFLFMDTTNSDEIKNGSVTTLPPRYTPSPGPRRYPTSGAPPAPSTISVQTPAMTPALTPAPTPASTLNGATTQPGGEPTASIYTGETTNPTLGIFIDMTT